MITSLYTFSAFSVSSTVRCVLTDKKESSFKLLSVNQFHQVRWGDGAMLSKMHVLESSGINLFQGYMGPKKTSAVCQVLFIDQESFFTSIIRHQSVRALKTESRC